MKVDGDSAARKTLRRRCMRAQANEAIAGLSDEFRSRCSTIF
jgi:hypothetical protein